MVERSDVLHYQGCYGAEMFETHKNCMDFNSNCDAMDT